MIRVMVPKADGQMVEDAFKVNNIKVELATDKTVKFNGFYDRLVNEMQYRVIDVKSSNLDRVVQIARRYSSEVIAF